MLKKKDDAVDNRIPGKILVCAPSNVAIDSLLRLYVKNGGLFEVGGKSNLKVLRIGPFVSDDLRSYSLEDIARKKCKFGKQMDDIKRQLFSKA